MNTPLTRGMTFKPAAVLGLILRIAFVIFIVEVMVTLILNQLKPYLSPNTVTFLDAFFLVLISTPVLYLCVIRHKGNHKILHVGPMVLDAERKMACTKDGVTIDFTPAEFSLLLMLARADGNVLSRKDIIDAISPGEGPTSTRSVDILVSRIRKKVGKDAILTVPKAGYECGWPV